MITAIDTNILLDILIPDEAHLTSSKKILDEYLSRGQLIICELVYAELASQFSDERELHDFLSDTGIRMMPSNKEILYLAARFQLPESRCSAKTKKGQRCISEENRSPAGG